MDARIGCGLAGHVRGVLFLSGDDGELRLLQLTLGIGDTAPPHLARCGNRRLKLLQFRQDVAGSSAVALGPL